MRRSPRAAKRDNRSGFEFREFFPLSSVERENSSVFKDNDMCTMLDFYESSEARNAPYKARLEIRKLPKRLGLDEVEDLVEFAADQTIFEDQIAIAGEAAFAGANNPKKARDQANSRIRTVLSQFLAARSGMPATADHPDYETVEAWVRANQGFVAKGDLFPQGRSAAIAMIRKWFGHIALRDITAADVRAVLVLSLIHI